MRYNSIILAALTCLLSFPQISKADTCKPLSLVGGKGTQVKKTVSQPTITGPFGMKITRSNWNTDWAVSGGRNYNYYIAKITSEEGGSFDVKMYLKYSDQTTDEFYNTQGVEITQNNPLRITATPRPNDEPYQVNLLVGGLDHIGNSYQASVFGCS
jgi:hypothetical protein